MNMLYKYSWICTWDNAYNISFGMAENGDRSKLQPSENTLFCAYNYSWSGCVFVCVSSFHAGVIAIGTEGRGAGDPTVSLSSLPNDLSTDRVSGNETENVREEEEEEEEEMRGRGEERGREGGRKRRREGGREGGREKVREEGKEGGREGEREGERERGRGRGREGRREGEREGERERGRGRRRAEGREGGRERGREQKGIRKSKCEKSEEGGGCTCTFCE